MHIILLLHSAAVIQSFVIALYSLNIARSKPFYDKLCMLRMEVHKIIRCMVKRACALNRILIAQNNNSKCACDHRSAP